MICANSARERVARKIVDRIAALQLELQGLHVLTEAATGAYAVTPVVAAAAGASVTALVKATRYGSVDNVCRQVLGLAADLNVANRIQIVETLTSEEIGRADIVTNSGHLRPLDAAFIAQMKPGAAIALMYESWELRPGEVDLVACKARGVRVAGTNECHPKIRVFEYLGILALLGLIQCQVPVCFSRILLICDNPFAPHIAKTLIDCGAELHVFTDTPLPESMQVTRRSIAEQREYDGVVVASTPGSEPIIGRASASKYTVKEIGVFTSLVQLWGDIDRDYLPHVFLYPHAEPRKGHMGILLSELGPDPIVRLQAGGLKVGEVLAKHPAHSDAAWGYCQRMEAPS